MLDIWGIFFVYNACFVVSLWGCRNMNSYYQVPTSKCTRNIPICTPLWKSNRNFSFRVEFDHEYQISTDCLWYVLKGPLKKLKSAKFPSEAISRGRVMKHWKKGDVNFAMSSSVELWRRRIDLTIKCAILHKLHSIAQTVEAGLLFQDFLTLCFHKWYFRKLYTIK